MFEILGVIIIAAVAKAITSGSGDSSSDSSSGSNSDSDDRDMSMHSANDWSTPCVTEADYTPGDSSSPSE